MYIGSKIQAIGAPRKTAPSGCEASREPARYSQKATVIGAYGNFIRVKWDNDNIEEDGWRRQEDFILTDDSISDRTS
jgi:hypothetical protein